MTGQRVHFGHVPASLRSRLTRDLGLVGPSPNRALSTAYGMGPTVAFVRDAWPTLREVWLGRSTPYRKRVVAELRAKRRGLWRVPVGNRAQELEYLRTCPPTPALCAIVLAAFRDFLQPASHPNAGRPDPSEFSVTSEGDLDREVEEGWASYTEWLGDALSCSNGDQLTVALPAVDVGSPRSGHELSVLISIARRRKGVVVATLDAVMAIESISLRYGVHDDVLTELGWRPGPGGLRLQGRASAHEELAATIVRSIRIFGVIHPSFLARTGLWPGDVEGEPEGYVADPADRITHYEIGSPERMRELVHEALLPLVGRPIEEDEDGDLRIEFDNTICFVRIGQDGAYISAFMAVAGGVEMTKRSYERVNRLNRSHRLAKFTLQRGVVFASMDLWCWPFVPLLVRQAVEGMSFIASEIESLREELGVAP